MIETQALTKDYGAKRAIDNVSFRAEKGEILGFLGPNGAGKTTTMRILTCFLAPTSGSAKVAGFDVFDSPIEVRRRIGYMPENVPLYDDMPTEEYLQFVAEVKGIGGRTQRLNKVGEAIESCGLQSVRNRIIGHLSKGFKQRVGLAQALLGDPEVLILDEPTVGLDPRQIVEIRKLIKNLAGQRTIVLSTHILPEVEATCGRVIIINEGRIVAQDTPRNLTQRLQGASRVMVSLKSDASANHVKEKLERIAGTKKVEQVTRGDEGSYCFIVESEAEKDLRADIGSAVVANKWQLLELRTADLSLEEIFIQTVG